MKRKVRGVWIDGPATRQPREDHYIQRLLAVYFRVPAEDLALEHGCVGLPRHENVTGQVIGVAS
jgi:hypothetical protein